ncbi:MAG: histidinol-phosphatase, partial [Prolixibacteraceae bacterium]|nr:histidinol-phosphatase [Prolixibacteraceae bacterium]
NQPFIPNNVETFGHQAWVDENEQIIKLIDKLLITGINKSINDVEKEVHRLGGIFMPAHIDKAVNSIISQLGFLPPKLKVDALEISSFAAENEIRKKFFIPGEITVAKNSDAHYLPDIGKTYSIFQLKDINFQEIKLALASVQGRKVVCH